MTGALIFALIAMALLAAAAAHAPEGFEDADGFHLGRPGDPISHAKDDAR